MRWGVALSGGGVLGAAHIGVMRALSAMDCEPDVFAGTSAGGLVALLWAAHVSADDLYQAGAEICRQPQKYFRWAWPKWYCGGGLHHQPIRGIWDPRPFIERLVQLVALDRHRVQSLDRPVGVTTVDLMHLQAWLVSNQHPGLPPGWNLASEASLATALHATMAIPGVFVPCIRESHLWVDGGLADNLPMDWALRLGATRVLAIDVAPPNPVHLASLDIGRIGQRTLEYFTQTMSRLRVEIADPGLASVLPISVATQHLPIDAFKEYAEIVDLGYEAIWNHREQISRFLTDSLHREN